MSFIKWSDSFSIDVEIVDEQHQQIFMLMNQVYDLLSQPPAAVDLGVVFQKLINYADYHFTTEETYFEKFDYAQKDPHIKAHGVYRVQVSRLIEEYQQNPQGMPVKLFEFLGDWWHGHIGGMDRLYTQCFHEHGLR